MTQDTWQYQGRQSHGEWGHGTAPHTAPPSRPGREIPPAPASLAERASYVAFGVVAYLTREMARQYELRLQHGMLDDLRKLLAASPAASHLGDAAYCQHLLGDAISLDATHSLRQAAAIIPRAPTLDDLEPGTVALADAVKSDGLPRFARAMQAAANAEPVPPPISGPTVDRSTAPSFVHASKENLPESRLDQRTGDLITLSWDEVWPDTADHPSISPQLDLKVAQQTCAQFIAANCLGSIWREFPGQFTNAPVE